jgi:hypothetical protein
MKTDKKGTCVYEKDIHVSHKGQSAATNRKILTLKFISFTMPSWERRLKESGKGKQKFDIVFFNFVS